MVDCEQAGGEKMNFALEVLREAEREQKRHIKQLKKDADHLLDFDPNGPEKADRLLKRIKDHEQRIKDLGEAADLILRETETVEQLDLFREESCI